MDLHKLVIKGASFQPEMMKKTIFKIIGKLQKMHLFKIPVKSPILQISEDLLFY